MKTGDTVGDFTLLDQDGTERRLSTMLEQGPVVLFFYPAAMSKGCTTEVCHFRDLTSEFSVVGAQPVGISGDDVARQHRFATEQNVSYPLLSDPDLAVAEAFGVKRRWKMAPVKRQTFVIGTDSTLIERISSEFSMESHADRALEVLRRP